MSNYHPAIWTDLRGCVANVWPQVQINLRTVQAKRVNWSNLIEQGVIVTPYVVIHVDRLSISPEWGLNNIVFESVCSFYYIMKDTGTDTAAFLEAKLKLMQDYVLAATTHFSAIQVLDVVDVDTTDMEEVMANMLKPDMQLSSGAIGFKFIVGEIFGT